MRNAKASDWVAVILASGVAISMIILITGVMWQAISHGATANSLSENEVQVLISAFGGIFGILGAFLGFKAGNGVKHAAGEVPPEEKVTAAHPAIPGHGWPQAGD